jgi:maltose O-acetyltransferase
MKILFKLLKLSEKVRYYYGRLYIRLLIENLGKYENCDISYPINVKNPSNLFLNEGVKIGPNCLFGAYKKITIGSNSRISSNCIIESGALDISKKFDNDAQHVGSDIHIGNNVWIGVGSIILSGVSIGENSFIAAGSVVSRDIPSNSIYKNNLVKKRNYEEDSI